MSAALSQRPGPLPKACFVVLFASFAAIVAVGLFIGSKPTVLSLIGVVGLSLCYGISGNQRLFCLWGLVMTAPLGMAKAFFVSAHMGGAAAIKIDLDDVFLVPLLIFVLRDYAKGWRTKLRFSPVLGWWAGLMLLATVDLMFGPLRQLAALELFRMAKCAILFFVLVNELTRVRQIMQFVAGLSCGVAMQAVFALLQHTLKANLGLQFLGEPVDEATHTATLSVYLGTADIYRAGGLFSHPNLLAGYLALLLPICIAMLFSRTAPPVKVALGGIVALGLAALAITLSRSGWLSFATGFSVLFGFSMLHRKLRLRYVLARILVLAAILAGIAVESGDIIRRFTESDPGALKFRFDMMDTSWRMIVDHPLLGLGVNSFVAHFAEYAPRPGIQAVNEVYGDIWPIVHDSYLVTWTEQGTVGFICLCGVYLSLLYIGWKTSRRLLDDLVYAVNLGACCGILAIMVDGIGSFFIDEDAGERVFWMVAALIVAINYWTQANGKAGLRRTRQVQVRGRELTAQPV